MKYIFLFEKFNKELVFYKFVDGMVIKSILKNGIIPNKSGGTWLIMKDELDSWEKENTVLGSFLQALMFFPSTRNATVYLLEIRTKSTQIKVRNVELLLKDFKDHRKSKIDFNEDNDYKVKEYLLM